jgi:hypothetical protein
MPHQHRTSHSQTDFVAGGTIDAKGSSTGYLENCQRLIGGIPESTANPPQLLWLEPSLSRVVDCCVHFFVPYSRERQKAFIARHILRPVRLCGQRHQPFFPFHPKVLEKQWELAFSRSVLFAQSRVIQARDVSLRYGNSSMILWT